MRYCVVLALIIEPRALYLPSFLCNKHIAVLVFMNFKSYNTQIRILMTLKKIHFENIVGKGEHLVMSIFSFSHLVSYPSQKEFV